MIMTGLRSISGLWKIIIIIIKTHYKHLEGKLSIALHTRRKTVHSKRFLHIYE